jgi:hypothetical protein
MTWAARVSQHSYGALALAPVPGANWGPVSLVAGPQSDESEQVSRPGASCLQFQPIQRQSLLQSLCDERRAPVFVPHRDALRCSDSKVQLTPCVNLHVGPKCRLHRTQVHYSAASMKCSCPLAPICIQSGLPEAVSAARTQEQPLQSRT